MGFETGIVPGDHLENQQICRLFQCSPQGGMRRSLRTNTLVLVSNHVKSIYDDRWIDNVLHYTGMGQSGNQTLDGTQNKTLRDYETLGVAVHLFEVFSARGYVYIGRVRLAGEPYQESQPDAHGRMRRVWMFPLTLMDRERVVPPISSQLLLDLKDRKRREARNLTMEELVLRARTAPAKVGRRSVVADHVDLSPWVAEYARRRANGICELCESDAPFMDRSGKPYLEIHHIVGLDKGGTDEVGNVVALCPNCCRKMEVLDPAADRRKLKLAARS